MGLNKEFDKAADKYRRFERKYDEKTGAFSAVVAITFGLLGLVIGVAVGAVLF